MLNKLNNYLRYNAKFALSVGSKLFSTTTKYIVNNISVGPTSFNPEKGVLATIITITKDGQSQLIKNIAPLPTSQHLYSFHAKFRETLIETQKSFPEHQVTATVIDNLQRVVYKVVETTCTTPLIGNNIETSSISDDW